MNSTAAAPVTAPAPDRLLVQPQWLAGHLNDPQLRILDCTTHMIPQPVGASKIESGRPDYLSGHLPGAQHIDMVEDLSDASGAYPYTLAPAAKIEALLSRLGVGNDHRIVLYARSSLVTLTRAWYVLRTMGHRDIALLDGGFARWQREGFPVVTERPSFASTEYRARFDARRVAGLEDVRQAIDDPGTLLVNALSREQFAGSGGAHYGRPGRIPGSVSVPARELSDAGTGCFESLDRLRQKFASAGLRDGQRVIHYCGGGIAATTTAFALELLGHDNWAVYDNSLLEWSTRSDAPMVKG